MKDVTRQELQTILNAFAKARWSEDPYRFKFECGYVPDRDACYVAGLCDNGLGFSFEVSGLELVSSPVIPLVTGLWEEHCEPGRLSIIELIEAGLE